MPAQPEDEARQQIDRLLGLCGWALQDPGTVNLGAARGVAIRNFPLRSGYGSADYLLYVDGKAAGVVEAKREGETLIGFEVQTERYSLGLPDFLPAQRRPLPFLYQSTGVETRFTNLLEPDARSRGVFAFHRPETLAGWLAAEAAFPGSILRARLRRPPPISAAGLRPVQLQAIQGLERSMRDGRPRALVQMASGAGKTFMACNWIYRLVKYANARRVLFLVDRGNLARQALNEFQQFDTPDDGRKFTELYNVQHMRSNRLDPVSRVAITTIQRLWSMLKGEEDFTGDEEISLYAAADVFRQPLPAAYNPGLPIESFDVIVTDECHRSIYNLWRQVLEYFDAFLIGLTATPSKQTLGFFNQDLVCEYNYEQAVADGVNVDHDIYVIQTRITAQGARVDAGQYVDKRDRQTRRLRWERLDEDFTYAPGQLDRDVVAKDQIRTVVRAFRQKLFSEIFPGRTEVPKTLIFAKDDSHAEDIVEIVREEFGRGNDFCEKITYKTGTARLVSETGEVSYQSSGVTAEKLLSSFRNSYNPRIAVTVDMIATGTDVRPLEIVFFMREVRSRMLFEQMKGRGARVIAGTELEAVTPDATAKTRFVMIDAVGLAHQELVDTHPLERRPHASFEALLDAVALGNRDPEVLSSLASRLTRLDRQLTREDRAAVESAAGGQPLSAIAGALVRATDPDAQLQAAQEAAGRQEPSEQQIAAARQAMLDRAASLLAGNPGLRQKLIEVKKSYEQTIDTVSRDEVLDAGYSAEARGRARDLVRSFEQYLRDNRNEITALQILYSRPYAARLTAATVSELADTLARPPRGWTPASLWQAYLALDRSCVRGSGVRVWTDVVSLVRFALGMDLELRPYADTVAERFDLWLARQEAAGRTYSAEQRRIVAEIEKQFTRLEAAEAALRRAQANLKRYRAAVLKAACEGRLVPTEAELARAEGHEDWALDREAGRQEARGLPPLPVGWCWRSLGSLLLSLRNGISVKPEGQLGIPILRISAVRPMRVDLRDIRHLSLSHAGKLGQYELTEGDLLFTRYNGNPELVGVCGCVRDNPSGTVYPDKLIRGRVQPDAALPKFIEVAVNTGESRSFLASRVRTTAGQAGISGADLKATPVPLPPLAGQHRIVAEVERRLSVVEQLEASVQANLQRAARLRQAILKRAFEGRLVPQDPDDEPASVLLERIRRQRAQQQTTRPVRRRPRKDVS